MTTNFPDLWRDGVNAPSVAADERSHRGGQGQAPMFQRRRQTNPLPETPARRAHCTNEANADPARRFGSPDIPRTYGGVSRTDPVLGGARPRQTNPPRPPP